MKVHKFLDTLAMVREEIEKFTRTEGAAESDLRFLARMIIRANAEHEKWTPNFCDMLSDYIVKYGVAM